MSLQGEKTKSMYNKAEGFIPYGVNSNFRYWGKEDTLIIARGDGPYIWDVDEKRYIDYRLAFGPVILGHSYPDVVRRVQDAIQDGTLFAWTTPAEVELAERITRLCRVDKVRLTNTGTEACMHALRIARAYTGREKFIKFEGHYHGMNDYLLFSTASSQKNALGSRRSPIPSSVSSGIPKGISEYVIVLPFNDFERLEATVRARWGEIAAIFVEPLMGNTAGIMPKPGYLEKIRELCSEYGIVMIMDEVKTGFRIAIGGAQEYFNIQADLVTYAKALGNGFPIAAIAGKEEVMMTVHPGQVAHGGTYTGNVVGTAAALATLDILEDQPIYSTMFKRGQRLMDGISEILTEAGIPHHMTGLPTIFGFILGTEQEPADFRDYCDSDDALYEKIVFELIRRGVMPDGDGREPWFLCYAHDDQIIDETLSIFNDAVKSVTG
ncbi:MAG TPA: guanitoxin biosynthesis PLP-dependent transaminase GntE [Anaerolineales bacterium]|nr:guanitoxin biosynthesis PLP-dependent transaminase GntE [Anaerolineales bacterium]